MKKLVMFICIFYSLLFVGCGSDVTGCYESIVKKYPDSKIILIPGQNFKYIIVTKNGYLKYIETMNTFDTGITFEFNLNEKVCKN